MAYLDALCSHLSRIQQHELRYLDNDGFSDLPKLCEKSVPEAVRAVRAHLQSINDLCERLASAAHFYCCLAVLGVIRPWALYRVDQGKDHGDVVHGIMRTMRHRRVYGCFSSPTSNVCSNCLLVPDEERGRDYKPYFFVIWNSQPCIAIHEAPGGHSPLLENALRQVLGSRPESFRCGVYQDLSSAHFGALQFFQ
ncbi:hypothetical protein MTO96_034214 [Rhipicephalus appendiculatus]